jgi:3-deoxy-manno-octulosonate cytidylyltransferase (CMP-KDO synthetase)
LHAFSKLTISPLEQAESLEQLRALWHGYPIAVHITPESPPPGVDTQTDLDRVRQFF